MPETQRHAPAQADVRSLIDNLKAELAERQQQQRPMPSSVFRAYQAKLDKYYGLLATCDEH